MKIVNQPHLLALLEPFSQSHQKPNQNPNPNEKQTLTKRPQQMWIAPIPGTQVVWTANLNFGLCGGLASANSQIPIQPLTHSSFEVERGVK